MGTTLTNVRTDGLTDVHQDQGRKSSVPNTRNPGDNRDSRLVEVTMTLPMWLWGRVASLADDQQRPVAGLIADAVRQLVDDNPRIPFERVSRLGILERELVAARASGYTAPGVHTSSKGKNA